MEPYRYCVTFRIFHPSLSPDEITENIGLKPSTTRKVGDPRVGPKGRELSGVWDRTSWCFKPHVDEYRVSSENKYVEDYLEMLTNDLSKHKEYFSQLVESGGSIEYFIGMFSEYSIGNEFSPRLLKLMGELNIGLSLDIYAYDE